MGGQIAQPSSGREPGNGHRNDLIQARGGYIYRVLDSIHVAIAHPAECHEPTLSDSPYDRHEDLACLVVGTALAIALRLAAARRSIDFDFALTVKLTLIDDA